MEYNNQNPANIAYFKGNFANFIMEHTSTYYNVEYKYRYIKNSKYI